MNVLKYHFSVFLLTGGYSEVFIKYGGTESLKAGITVGKETLTLSVPGNGAVRWEGGM